MDCLPLLAGSHFPLDKNSRKKGRSRIHFLSPAICINLNCFLRFGPNECCNIVNSLSKKKRSETKPWRRGEVSGEPRIALCTIAQTRRFESKNSAARSVCCSVFRRTELDLRSSFTHVSIDSTRFQSREKKRLKQSIVRQTEKNCSTATNARHKVAAPLHVDLQIAARFLGA